MVIPNLWGGAVGRPSVLLKSPAIEQALTPLAKLEKVAKENHEEELKTYEAELAGHKAQKDAFLCTPSEPCGPISLIA